MWCSALSTARWSEARLQEPLYVANECLKAREYRPPREKTRDYVERALVDQAAAVQNSMNTLSSAHHACTAELERLLALKDLLERDIGDKAHSAALDSQCLGLAEGKFPLQPVDFSASGIDAALAGNAGAIQAKSSGLPYVWKQSSNNLMDEAFKAMATAQRVRCPLVRCPLVHRTQHAHMIHEHRSTETTL